MADVVTGLVCPATSGNTAVGLPNETAAGPVFIVHVAVSVAPAGSPSSVTLPVNVVIAGCSGPPKFRVPILSPCEPQIAIWPSDDLLRIAVACGNRKLRDDSAGGDSADVVPSGLSEP